MFSPRTLSHLVEILERWTDNRLQTFFFSHGLGAQYKATKPTEAKRSKLNRVFGYLAEAPQDQTRRTQAAQIVQEVLAMVWPSGAADELERREFFARHGDVVRALRADGFEVRDGVLVPTTSDSIEPAHEEGLLERLLDSLGLHVARTYLSQACENYALGHWEAANACLRSFLQEVFDQIAIMRDASLAAKPAGGERRKALVTNGFIEAATEAPLVQSFFNFAHQKGAHPGLSAEFDTRMRRYMAVALALYFLEKLDHVKKEDANGGQDLSHTS